jgi:ankyrin repeat protein
MSFLIEAFAQAIENHQIDFAEFESMIANGSIDANVRLPRANRPPALMRAALFGRNEIVEILLKAGARIDDCDDEGHNACHAAMINIHTLQLLLAHRPNLALLNARGRERGILEHALTHTVDQEIWIALVKAGAPLGNVPADLICMLAARSAPALQSLIDRGVDVRNIRDVEGKTPLHIATERRRRLHPEAVLNMLIHVCQVDLEARDVYGNTCTHVAAFVDNVDALRLFIAAGADVNSVGRDRKTPLHMAGYPECTFFCLPQGQMYTQLIVMAERPAQHWAGTWSSTPCSPHALICAAQTTSILSNLIKSTMHDARLRLRGANFQDCGSTLFGSAHCKFALVFNRVDSTRCKCARFFCTHVAHWRHH